MIVSVGPTFPPVKWLRLSGLRDGPFRAWLDWVVRRCFRSGAGMTLVAFSLLVNLRVVFLGNPQRFSLLCPLNGLHFRP